jgi:hypothetical protein
MGDTVQCRAHFNKQTSEGTAMLETEELIFRGDFRVKVLLKEIESIKTQEGNLVVASPQGRLILELGPRAEKWASKILNPKSVIDKLGIKEGQRVSLVGLDDQTFLNQLKERGVEVFTGGRAKKESDVIFLLAEEAKVLERLETLKASIKRDGAIWVVFPKGKQHIKEPEVIQKGREAGLVDTKIVAFSAIYSAHKFVIPVAER